MRTVCIPALLLATYTCAEKLPLTARQPRPLLAQGRLVQIAADQRRLGSAILICLVTAPDLRMLHADHLIFDEAETLTNLMFVPVKVRLQWHQGPACPAGESNPIFIIIQTGAPEAYLPGALGAALPLNGSHAWVFYDRVRHAASDDRIIAALLAHVMAHEIGHLLQGVVHHLDDGILKAHWSATDCARMAYFPLRFTQADGILIRRGLEDRRSRLGPNPIAGVPTSRSTEIPDLAERPVP